MKRLTDKGIRRSVVLTGTRRVGKTTIQYQMIEALLKSGVAPQKIVFISLDHPMLKLSQFQDVLECYHEMQSRMSITSLMRCSTHRTGIDG